jgi:hypothetical protein
MFEQRRRVRVRKIKGNEQSATYFAVVQRGWPSAEQRRLNAGLILEAAAAHRLIVVERYRRYRIGRESPP